METLDRFPCARECNYCVSRALKIIKMAQNLCLLCKCEAAKKTRSSLRVYFQLCVLYIALLGTDRGETADDP